jgi:hypothetical protein
MKALHSSPSTGGKKKNIMCKIKVKSHTIFAIKASKENITSVHVAHTNQL